jgi:hypothetical protein
MRWLEESPSPVRWLEALPSGESATELVAGDAGALPKVVFHTTVRAGLIAVAMFAAAKIMHDTKMQAPGPLLKYSAAGAVGIEAFVLLWALYEKNKKESSA